MDVEVAEESEACAVYPAMQKTGTATEQGRNITDGKMYLCSQQKGVGMCVSAGSVVTPTSPIPLLPVASFSIR